MLDKLSNRLARIPHLRRLLTAVLLLLIGLFSALLFTSFWEAARFRDALIARKYEGSLSGDLGFLAVLTSEASLNYHFESPHERQRTARIRTVLKAAGARLESLKPVPQAPGKAPPALEATLDDNTLLQLLGSPVLGKLSPAALGLAASAQSDLTAYPFLEPWGEQPRGARAGPVHIKEVHPGYGRQSKL